MGLDTSHNCWHGSYSSFMAWRRVICKAAGLGDLLDHKGYGGTQDWPTTKDEPLVALLFHSDCCGQLEVNTLLPISQRLMSLLDDGLIPSDWMHKTEQFVEGLILADSRGEPVEFR